MCGPSLRCWLAVGLVWGAQLAPAAAQQASVEVPFVGINHGFFERIGLAWGLSAPGFNAQFNNVFAAALPQFGGFQPGAGLAGGVGFGGAQGGLIFEAAQGIRASNSSQVPLIVLPNGQAGFVGDVVLQPFVFGLVPIVNDYAFSPTLVPAPTVAAQALAAQRAARASADQDGIANREQPQLAQHPVAAPQQAARRPPPSTAHQPVVSLAELRRRKAEARLDARRKLHVHAPLRLAGQDRSEDDASESGPQADQPANTNIEREAEEYFELGLDAERKGQLVEARVAYRLAAKRAHGVLREVIQHKLASLAHDD